MKKTTFYLSIIACLILSTTAISQSEEVYDGTLPNVTVIQDANAPSVSNTIRTQAALLFDNGPHFNVPGNPPTTAHRSVLENVTLNLNTLGGGVSGDFRIADDFTLTDDANITEIDLYGYQTGAPNTPNPISEATIQIWDGNPSLGGTVVWGNTVDNLLSFGLWSDTYRESESSPGDTRAIFRVTCNTPALTLTAGTYWLDWGYVGDPTYSGPWQPPVVVLGQVPMGNALQSNTGVYGPWLDSGADMYPMDAPFQIRGDVILGVNDFSTEHVSIFPNPTERIINIANGSTSQLESVEIYNLLGKLVQTVDLSDNDSNEINISELSSGIYMLQINSESGSISKKLIKK